MSSLRTRLSAGAAAALVALACLLFSLSSRGESAAQAGRAPRFQLGAVGEKSAYTIFLLDTESGQVWEYGSHFGQKEFKKLLDGPK